MNHQKPISTGDLGLPPHSFHWVIQRVFFSIYTFTGDYSRFPCPQYTVYRSRSIGFHSSPFNTDEYPTLKGYSGPPGNHEIHCKTRQNHRSTPCNLGLLGATNPNNKSTWFFIPQELCPRAMKTTNTVVAFFSFREVEWVKIPIF